MEYNPGCSKCRDEAGKDRAGIIDSSLCVPHLRARVAELEAELSDYKTELRLAIGRLELNPLPDDNMIHNDAEIRRLYAIAKESKAEVERLRKALLLAINNFDDEGYHCIADTLKAALRREE